MTLPFKQTTQGGHFHDCPVIRGEKDGDSLSSFLSLTALGYHKSNTGKIKEVRSGNKHVLDIYKFSNTPRESSTNLTLTV